MRLDGDPDVLEVAVDVLHVPKVRSASLVEQKQLVEHVEHLGRRLVHADHDGLLLQLGVPLEYFHQRNGRVAVQSRSGFLPGNTRNESLNLHFKRKTSNLHPGA